MAQTEHRSRLGRQAVAAPDDTVLGELLRQHRERLGWSQEELAARVEPPLSANTVSNLERGRTRPYRHTLAALCDALGLEATERQQLEAAWHGSARPAQRGPRPEGGADAQAAPALVPESRVPIPLTPLIGREAELQAIAGRLRPGGARLLTLLGPGGVGKTRLGLAVAEALGDAYADGAAWVDLAPLREVRLVAATIARVLGLRESDGRSARELLLEHLGPRQLLLVLDNCEQLPGLAPLVLQLLQACPCLGLLATSRVPLKLRHEQRFVVGPLATPAADAEASVAVVAAVPAVRLLVERAQAVEPDFTLDAGNAETVAALCRRLEGLPLAIELAAGRLSLLSPAVLLRRLERRLPLLTGGAADLPERQQTLRAMLAWSYDLLGPAEQVLFRRLAVFAGGWTLEAAEFVCADAALSAEQVLDGLAVLVDSSLVRPLNDAEVEPRFSMLETMREFALDLLQTSGELEVLHARHAAYLLQMAGQVITALKDSGHTDAIVGLGRERDNLRAALAWLASLGDQQPALRLAAAAAWVWMAEGQVAEGREQLTRLLALTPEPTPARATALLSAAMLAWGQGDYQMQERLARESLAIAQAEGLPEETAEALSTLGAAAFQRGEYDTARGLLVESLDRFRGLGQRLGIGWALMRLASVARDQGQFAEAERLYEEALALRRAAGDRTGVAHILSNLSWLALYAGAHARARTLQEESLVIRREGGDRREVAMSLIVLARIALAQGARTAAWAPLQEGIDLCRAIGDRWAIALALEALAGLIAMNQPASALRLAGAAATLRAAIGRPMPAPERPIVEAWLEPAWRALGEAATAAWAAGASMPLDSIAQQLLIEFDTAAACPPRSP